MRRHYSSWNGGMVPYRLCVVELHPDDPSYGWSDKFSERQRLLGRPIRVASGLKVNGKWWGGYFAVYRPGMNNYALPFLAVHVRLVPYSKEVEND